MVKQITIHEFVTQNGYELVEKLGKSETSRLLTISRPTIDAILKEHPTAPNKTLPKYVFQWEETEGNRLFNEKYQGKLGCFRNYLYHGFKAWLMLGKKDPVSWNIEDFRKLWHAEERKDLTTGKIRYENATILRKWMKAIGKTEFCNLEEFSTTGLKRPKGLRKQWFLEDEEITRLIEAIDRDDLLVAFVVALLSGGRASSVMPTETGKGVRPMDIDEKNSGILMFEPKRKKYMLRLFHRKVIELLRKHIMTHGIKPNEPIFLSYGTMRVFLKDVALKARISKLNDMHGSWHITKHTFVSQGMYHGLSMEVVVEQAGTDATTLLDFYAGMKEKKLRAELLGEKIEVEPFHAWALRVIIEPALRRYEQLRVTKQLQTVTSDK